jgi:hypothetical protein
VFHRPNHPRRPPRPARPLRARRRGLTFIELLIALGVTSVTCGILAVLINSTATGTNAQNDGRRGLVRMQALKAGLQDEFTNARAILAAGTNYVVYWTGDKPGAYTPANNAVNLSELRMLELDTATGDLKVWYARYPAGWSPANIVSADSLFAATSSWYDTCQSLKAASVYVGSTTIATGVTGMNITLDAALPTSAKMIHFQIDMNDGSVARSLAFDTGLVYVLAPN